MTNVIHILFLETASDEPNLVNYITSAYGRFLHGKGIHHVEICFPENRTSNQFISSSIYAGETVSMNRIKTFANPNYIVCSKLVSNEELKRIREFVTQSHRNMVEFDGIGMYLASLPFSVRRGRPDATFCSRYVTEVLQAAGIQSVQRLNPCITSPSKLFKVVSQEGDPREVCGSVEYKQKAMCV